MRLESFRNTLHRIAGPLPRPAAHEIVPLGGWEAGESHMDLNKYQIMLAGTA